MSADGRTVWVLIRRLNSSCRRSIAFVVRALFHGWVEGKQALARLLEAVGDGEMLEAPFADEGRAPRLDLSARRRRS